MFGIVRFQMEMCECTLSYPKKYIHISKGYSGISSFNSLKEKLPY